MPSVTAPVRATQAPPPQAPQAPPAVRATTELSFEEPYPLDARPRAASPLQAAADDEELARWNLGGTADPSYPSNQASFHPGTRVVVDAELPRRLGTSPRGTGSRLGAERIQAQARSKGYWPFRLCFEAGQREKKGVGGETRLRFTVSARGNVTAARLLSTELRNAASSACLLAELRRIRFAPQLARRVDVIASIGIWPGDAELPPLSAAPMPVDTSGGFEPTTVRTRASGKQAELSACFSEARRADPTLWGRLALAVVLEVDGTVHRVSEVESHFPNPVAARCAAAVLSAIVFPSVNGKPFSFVLPLRLPPSGPAPRLDSSPYGGPRDPKPAPSAPSTEEGGGGG